MKGNNMNIDQWIMDASRGDKIVYHTGYMASDICDDLATRLLNKKINEYCQQKLITVTHRCLVKSEYKGTYEYIAFKL